eukprot:COSAG01_NODE_1009_length_12151_cov_18.810571_4_plen_58_part_00
MFEPEIYRGQDTINEFLCRMKTTEHELMELIQTNVEMVMTPQDEMKTPQSFGAIKPQ